MSIISPRKDLASALEKMANSHIMRIRRAMFDLSCGIDVQVQHVTRLELDLAHSRLGQKGPTQVPIVTDDVLLRMIVDTTIDIMKKEDRLSQMHADLRKTEQECFRASQIARNTW